MRAKNRYLYLSEAEWRVMLLALNSLRSKLIAQGRYTDAVDEIILKMAGYPSFIIQSLDQNLFIRRTICLFPNAAFKSTLL